MMTVYALAGVAVLLASRPIAMAFAASRARHRRSSMARALVITLGPVRHRHG